MAKTKTLYVCQSCAFEAPRWEGQCRGCGGWNTLVEELRSKPVKSQGGRGWTIGHEGQQQAQSLQDIQKQSASQPQRTTTGLNEFDRVLGGGIVSGSYILLGGDPGIGKSTLLLQMAGAMALKGHCVIYVSGEESVEQTSLRAHRLGLSKANLLVAAESQLENISNLAKTHKPTALIVDSIQTVYMQELQSAPGSVAQVRECASHLMSLAKSMDIAVFLIGHVTKDGHIAGPKVLEHMVDTVLSFEGDGNHQYRLLRALKNRFGATNELGVFQMQGQGLTEVDNPSEIFLEERGEDVCGSTIFSAVEGSRPLLCEVQALSSVSPTTFPRRTSLGFDINRVHLLVAVLSKHLDFDFSKSDVFVNMVGGLKINEPAADLAVAAALISSHLQLKVNPQMAFAGEVGLTGEVRGVAFIEDRVREAEKLGFKHLVLPQSNKKHLKNLKLKINTLFVRHVDELKKIMGDTLFVPRLDANVVNEFCEPQV